MVTSILGNVTIHRSVYVLVTTCVRVVTNSYELVTNIHESKKYINPANLNVQQIVQKIVTIHLRILASSLRMVTCCCVRFMILTDCYVLFTEKPIRGQSSEDF